MAPAVGVFLLPRFDHDRSPHPLKGRTLESNTPERQNPRMETSLRGSF